MLSEGVRTTDFLGIEPLAACRISIESGPRFCDLDLFFAAELFNAGVGSSGCPAFRPPLVRLHVPQPLEVVGKHHQRLFQVHLRLTAQVETTEFEK